MRSRGEPERPGGAPVDVIALGGVVVFLALCLAIAWAGWALYHPGAACRG